MLGAYEVQTAPEGFSSIRHLESGEIMHARTSPLEEARRLYVEQSALAERLRLPEAAEPGDAPLVMWDVGLGAAANAMAAIQCYESVAADGPSRAMRLISFENDLDALKLARRHHDLFPYLRHSGPAGILKEGRWESKQHPGLAWRLVVGDFLETMAQADDPPDLIFYDMFSINACSRVWTIDAFRCLFAVCEGRAVELFTYTSSTAIRAALLAAGFLVAKGCGIGERGETTIALTPTARAAGAGSRHELLSLEWLGRWERSDARIPAEVPAENRLSFERAVRDHQQFARG
jgi:queuine tRNA-ribosyltransferase